MLAAARCSLVGRFFLAVVRILGRVFADSVTFGTRHAGSRRLGRSGHPVSVLAISRPCLWLRAALGGGAPGRMFEAAEVGAAHSRFGGGIWLTVAGGGIFALGCGRLALLLAEGSTTFGETGSALNASEPRLVVPVIVIVVGGLVFATGPRLAAAFRTSLFGRGLGLLVGPVGAGADALSTAGGADTGGREAGPLPWRRLVGPAGVGVVLAMAAGLAAGLTHGSGPLALVALVAAACALMVVVWRPELMLLAVAAFPWLDWAARRTLGGFGPAWDDAFLILSVVLLALCVLVLRRWELWTVPIALPTLLALAAAIGSVVVRDVPGDVALFALRVLFQPLLFYFVGFLFLRTSAGCNWSWRCSCSPAWPWRFTASTSTRLTLPCPHTGWTLARPTSALAPTPSSRIPMGWRRSSCWGRWSR